MSKFTKQHYEVIAEVIHDLHELYDGVPGESAVGAHLVLNRVAEALTELFAEDNPEFHVLWFKDACEMGQKFADEPEKGVSQ